MSADKIIYFHKAEGWFKYGKFAGDAIHYRGGIYTTHSPIVLEAAAKDLKNGSKHVASIADLVEPQVVEPEPPPPPAPKLCSRCKVMVDAADWVEHVAGHGRNKKA